MSDDDKKIVIERKGHNYGCFLMIAVICVLIGFIAYLDYTSDDCSCKKCECHD